MKNKLLTKCINLSYRMLDLPTSNNKHFSFLVIRNKVLSIGWSLGYTTHPIANKYNYRFNSIHSELKAIKNFPFEPSQLTKCTLINIRIMANGKLGLSKPCKKCQQLLNDFDINSVMYSTNIGDFKWMK